MVVKPRDPPFSTDGTNEFCFSSLETLEIKSVNIQIVYRAENMKATRYVSNFVLS